MGGRQLVEPGALRGASSQLLPGGVSDHAGLAEEARPLRPSPAHLGQWNDLESLPEQQRRIGMCTTTRVSYMDCREIRLGRLALNSKQCQRRTLSHRSNETVG